MARLNENENENENEGAGGGRSGLFAGSRYNTYKILKQAFAIPPAGGGQVARSPNIPKFEDMGGWDAENKGWVFISDFMQLRPTWFAELRMEAESVWIKWKRANEQTAVNILELEPALLDIIDAAGEREDRFAEILHQRDAEGCITYWMGMLGIESAKHPNTYQLIRVARKLGEMIVMCLKAEINAARPSQICPAIVPAFDPPRTASYPSGHALQSYLISYFLRRVMPNMPQSAKPTTWEEPHEGLFALARRVADNRVIAGVHFDIDNKAGFFIAKKVDEWIDAWLVDWIDNRLPVRNYFGNFLRVMEEARTEFPQWQ